MATEDVPRKPPKTASRKTRRGHRKQNEVKGSESTLDKRREESSADKEDRVPGRQDADKAGSSFVADKRHEMKMKKSSRKTMAEPSANSHERPRHHSSNTRQDADDGEVLQQPPALGSGNSRLSRTPTEPRLDSSALERRPSIVEASSNIVRQRTGQQQQQQHQPNPRPSVPGAFRQPGIGRRSDSDEDDNSEDDEFVDEEGASSASAPSLEQRSSSTTRDNITLMGTLVEEGGGRRERVPPTLSATLLPDDDGDEEQQLETRRLAKNQRWMYAIVFIIGAVVVAILVVILGQSSGSNGDGNSSALVDNNDEQQQQQPSQVPTPTPTTTESPTQAPTFTQRPTASPTDEYVPLLAVNYSSGFPCMLEESIFDVVNEVAFPEGPGIGNAGAGFFAKGDSSSCFFRLTADVRSVAASAFAPMEYRGQPFRVEVQYRIYGREDRGNLGADGMVFVMHQDERGKLAIGGTGSDLGYFGRSTIGIEKSFGVSLIQFERPRVGIVNSGAIEEEGSSPQVNTRGGPDQIGKLWIDYCPLADFVRVYQNVLGDVKVFRADAKLFPSILWDLGKPIYVGFTAATGLHFDNHEVHSYVFSVGEFEGCFSGA